MLLIKVFKGIFSRPRKNTFKHFYQKHNKLNISGVNLTSYNLKTKKNSLILI